MQRCHVANAVLSEILPLLQAPDKLKTMNQILPEIALSFFSSQHRAVKAGSLTKRRQIPKLLHALTALALRTAQALPTPTPAFSPPFKGPQTGPTAAGRGLPGAGAEEDEEEGGRPYLCVPAHRP